MPELTFTTHKSLDNTRDGTKPVCGLHLVIMLKEIHCSGKCFDLKEHTKTFQFQIIKEMNHDINTQKELQHLQVWSNFYTVNYLHCKWHNKGAYYLECIFLFGRRAPPLKCCTLQRTTTLWFPLGMTRFLGMENEHSIMSLF